MWWGWGIWMVSLFSLRVFYSDVTGQFVFNKWFFYMYAVLGGVGVPSASDLVMLSCLHRFMNLNSMIISFLSPPSLLFVPPDFLDVLPHTASSGIIHIHILYFYTSNLPILNIPRAGKLFLEAVLFIFHHC